MNRAEESEILCVYVIEKAHREAGKWYMKQWQYKLDILSITLLPYGYIIV